MGAWGVGIFENDDACDFAADGGGLAVVERALDRVLATNADYIEAKEGQEGLAAADIISRLNVRSSPQAPATASIDTWVKSFKSVPSEELIKKARRSISRILSESSEILELWQESEEFEAWKRGVEAALARL